MGFQCLGAAALAGLIQGMSPTGVAAAIALPTATLELEAAEVLPLAEGAETPEAAPFDSAPATSPPGLDAEIQVQTILVEGSTVFGPAVLAQAVAPFEGQVMTLAALQGAANAVTQLYLNAGYITSEAVLPPQANIQSGVVTIQVIEGGLEEIRVVGTDRLVGYVQQRIALAGTSPLNQNQLESQLQLLQRDPLFENVEASLRQGATDNNSILTVRVTEADSLSGSLAIDTLSSRSVGEFRTGATLLYRNLAGWGDRLVASAYRSTTGGSNAYELAYLVPLNPQEGTLLLRANPSNFRITDPAEPTFVLGLSGSTDLYEIQYRQPLIRTLQAELALSAGFSYRNGSTLLGGLITPPTITSVVTFGQDYLRRDAGGAWGLQSQFRVGTGLFGATSQPAPLPSGQFFSWQGQVQRVQVLGPDHRLLVQGAVQLTPNSLLGSEQFFIGGAQSVRGYFQNGRFGDSGLRLSVEDQITVLRDEGNSPLLSLSPFVDLGYVWATNPDFQANGQNFMLGAGLGVEMAPLDDLNARVDFGLPLVELNERASDRPSGLRVYFDLRYRF
jgi:hemolysin activation/secretion protein